MTYVRTKRTKYLHTAGCFKIYNYRGSPDSTNFGSKDNRVIKRIVLIGDWFFTKTHEIDKFDFQSPLFT